MSQTLPENELKESRPPVRTLVYTGERKDAKIDIHLIDYDEQQLAPKRRPSRRSRAFPYKDKPTVTWINVDGVHERVHCSKSSATASAFTGWSWKTS